MVIWVYANFAERSDMARHSLAAFLIMPNVVRGLDLPGACAPRMYSWSFDECTGGVCGVSYRISYGTTVNRNELADFVAASSVVEGLRATSVRAILNDDSTGCNQALMFVDVNERYIDEFGDERGTGL